MVDIDKLDDELYKSVYGVPRRGNHEEIWNKIKNNTDVLREAVKIVRDKFDENDLVKGLTICDLMLIDYKTIDKVAYNNLIKSIYSNTDIARIVIDGASNGGYSFLLMSLWNPNLKLTEEQKAFAVNEAMNKIGTTRWLESERELSKKLDNMGVSDDNTTFIDVGGSMNPIGQKSASVYMNYMFSMVSKTQAHGVGEFDIRYYILKNSNWSIEEKKKLVYDFWCDDETYYECLEQWEWAIVNDIVNFKDEPASLFQKIYMYDYSYDLLLKFYEDKEITDRIWADILFCREMHQLRPLQRELDDVQYKKKLLNKDYNIKM